MTIIVAIVACMISGGLGAIAGAWCMYRFMRNDWDDPVEQQGTNDG